MVNLYVIVLLYIWILLNGQLHMTLPILISLNYKTISQYLNILLHMMYYVIHNIYIILYYFISFYFNYTRMPILVFLPIHHLTDHLHILIPQILSIIIYKYILIKCIIIIIFLITSFMPLTISLKS